MYEPKTIDRAISPLLLMQLITGSGVFSDSNNRYGTELYDNLYFLNVFMLNRISIKYTHMANAIIMGSLIALGRLNAKKVKNVIALFNKYDQTAEEIGFPREYRVVYQYQLYAFAISALFILTSAIIQYLLYLPPMLQLYKKTIIIFVLHFPLLLDSVGVISFCFWIRCLELKFQQLNDLLRSIEAAKPDLPEEKRILTMVYDFNNKKFSSLENDDIKGDALTMRLIKQAHLELIKIADVVNSTFGVQILLLIFSAFSYLVTFLHTNYKILWLSPGMEQTVRLIVLPTFAACFFGFEIFVVGHACGRTSTESASTGDLFCKLYQTSTSKEFRAEIRDFTLQMVQNPLTFTACGFFTVDHSFILSVIGVVITYLVILIQMEDTTTKTYRRLLENNITIENDAPISCNDFNMNCTIKYN
ncbi:putative gustatory receptor 28b [Osmia bicornis bicornis]|uniref:putative gustatory receptor 28b n=1 Tax=Osmia bicornis bicornis TaxID=1437191 RepID=UPI001EAEDAFE|nr:putative gustatory receptor 28b [Osmia bicornis bicornis]